MVGFDDGSRESNAARYFELFVFIAKHYRPQNKMNTLQV